MAELSPNAAAHAQRWLGWKVISLLAPHRTTVFLLAILIVIASGFDIAVPFLTRSVIDNILKSLQHPHSGSVAMLIAAASAIFAATAITRLVRSFYNYRLFRTVSRAEDELKNAAFNNFLYLDTEYHGSVNTGEIIGALDRGCTAIFVVLYEILGQNLIPPLLILVGVLVSLLSKNVWVAGIIFLPLPAYVLAVSRLGGRMHALEQKVSHAFETVTKDSYDIASNVRVVKKFNREQQEARHQRKLLDIARDHQYRGERMWALVENTQTFIATAGRVGVIAFGGYLVLAHRCTVGDYVLFIAMQDMVYGPISQLSIILPKLRRNLSRAERVFEILEQRRTVCDAPDAERLATSRPSIEFCNVSFQYAGSDNWALRNVSFSVPAGATVALIGPSGSGKSTTMNLLQRLYDPREGSIRINGKDLRDFTQESLREHIAVVPQEVDLFSRSILENIAYGRDQISPMEVERATEMAQAHEFVERCSSGYRTQVGERGLKLSGGERQRIGIARAILRDPQILILDEATSHLDNESERLIQAAMEKLTRGRTSFIIAHRLSTVRKADLVIVFVNGTVEAIGTHDELWRTSPTYQKLHGLHLAGLPKRRATDLLDEEAPFLLPAVGE